MLQVSLHCHFSAKEWRRRDTITIQPHPPVRFHPRRSPVFTPGRRTYLAWASARPFSTTACTNLGKVSSEVDYKTGLAAAAAFGWAFNRNVALDFETGFIGAKIKHVPRFSSDDSSLYNGVVSRQCHAIPAHSAHRFVPYIGAGVGGTDVGFATDLATA